MSQSASAVHAIEWLGQQIGELAGIRNATARDPSFKNWRQNTLTVMQRIWPGDTLRCERFRRIPFSPADTRADARVQREWYSRGCQEAARVLTSFVDEIRTKGVPEMPAGLIADAMSTEFEDDFPTVDLPAADADTPEPEYPAAAIPPAAPPPPMNPEPGAEHRGRKGLGMAAKLRDLLGFAGLSAKAITGPLLEPFNSPPPPPTPARPPAEPDPSDLGIIPVGDEVMPPPPVARHTPPPAATAPEAASPAPAAPSPSVVMRRPGTLRANVEKVSIESLISPEFRAGAEGGEAGTPSGSFRVVQGTGPSAGHGSPPSGTPAGTPPLSVVPPLSGDPEFNVDPASSPPPRAGLVEPTNPAATPSRGAGAPAKVVPLPLPPAATVHGRDARDVTGPEANPTTPAEAEAAARATEDFLRSSPVLGATAHKVQRQPEEGGASGLHDPDALAILSIVEELALMGVPTTRQSETRARLLDLARRIERDELEWNALRKAVWFAMEYPELARRLLPVLLPWIDRAA